MSKIERITTAEAVRIASTVQKGPIHQIIEAVARESGIPASVIRSTSRKADAARARQRVMWLARQTGMSTPAIGRAMKRDHSTVLHGVQAEEARRRAQEDPLDLIVTYSVTATRGLIVNVGGREVCVAAPDRLSWLAAQVAVAAHQVQP